MMDNNSFKKRKNLKRTATWCLHGGQISEGWQWRDLEAREGVTRVLNDPKQEL
jgi:hypothetical protein